MMSAFLKKLLFVRQFSMVDGKIEMLGKREIMLPSNFIFQIQLNTKNMYEISKKSSYESMKEFGDKMGNSEEGLIKNLKDIYETFGFGQFELVDLKNDKKQAIIEIKDSSIAKEYSKTKKGKGPKCDMLAGILAGMFSYVFGSDVDATETKCLSTGNPYCIFNIGTGEK